MAATGADVFKLFAVFFFILFFIYVNKETNTCSSDGFIDAEGIANFCNSLLIDKARRLYRKHSICTKINGKMLFLLLLLYLCGDIEKCPGPALTDICKQSGFKVLHQNIRGLESSYEDIYELLDSQQGIDVLTLSETHVLRDLHDDFFNIEGYEFVNKPRTTGLGGGVAVYLKKSIKWKRRLDLEKQDVENITLEIFPHKSKSFLIITIYKPPKDSKYLSKNFDNYLDEILNSALSTHNEIILLGDCNVNFATKDQCDFKSILTTNGFKQIIKEKTRTTQQSSTLIDIIATTAANTIKSSFVIQTTFSDHDMVGCVRKLHHVKYPEKCIKTRDFRKYDHEKLNNDIKTADWSVVINATNAHRAVEFFNDILLNIFNLNAPFIEKKIKSRPCPWIDDATKVKMKERDQCLRKARRTNNDEDWKRYRSLRNNCSNMLRKSRSTYYENLLTEHQHDPKNFWNIIKKIYPVSRKSPLDGNSSCADKANIFSTYFYTAVRNIKHAAIKLTDFTWRKPTHILPKTLKEFKFSYVSTVFVCNQLKQLKRKKATGGDDLTTSMIKDSANSIAPILSHVINLSLNTGTFPNAWKIAKVAPIYKSGPINDPENYRPISVLPVVSKVIERAVKTQLMEFLETNNLIDHGQYGYRKNHSTEEAATKLCDDIRRHANNGCLVGAVFVDLRKAFDTISHGNLTQKLWSYGVRSTELEWFTSYLFNRRQKIHIEEQLSKEQPLTSGVPQGSILGPLLFFISFNDLRDSITFSSLIMYADDTVMYYPDKDINIINSHLNQDLEALSRFCRENELVLNMKKGKTEALLFGTAKRIDRKKLMLKINETDVNVTERYVYLGNILDSTLTLKEDFMSKYKKAAIRINLLRKTRHLLTKKATENIFEMMIVPLITYCGNLHIVDSLTTETQKNLLTSIEKRYKDLVKDTYVQPIHNRLKLRTCLYVKKCINGDVCDNFKNYFKLINHDKNTRNNLLSLKLPSAKTELYRKSLAFAGPKLYNELPIELRSEKSFKVFETKVSEYFKF